MIVYDIGSPGLSQNKGCKMGFFIVVHLLSFCRDCMFFITEGPVRVRERPPSAASTSSSEISVVDDNTSLDMLQDVLQNRDILRTKVSQTMLSVTMC